MGKLAEGLITTAVVLVLIRLVVALFQGVLWDLPLAVVPVLFMWAPVWVLTARGEDPDRYPLAVPGLDEPRVWLRAAGQGLAVAAALAVPFVVAYHVWQTVLLPDLLRAVCDAGWRGVCGEARRAAGFGPSWTLPPEPLKLVLYHTFFVAIPEELFYRGYLQSRLDEVWAPRWSVGGAMLGPGWLVTCLVFALGHSVVSFQWWHVFIFFPALVFGWLRARTGSVLPGAFFHAACNVGVAFLDAMWGVSAG